MPPILLAIVWWGMFVALTRPADVLAKPAKR